MFMIHVGLGHHSKVYSDYSCTQEVTGLNLGSLPRSSVTSYSLYVKNTHPNATAPSAFEWYYIERLAIDQENFGVTILAFAVTFVGLYIGSMIKKPAQTLTPETPQLKQKKGT